MAGEYIKTTTITKLDDVENINENDVLLLSQKQEDNSYVSKKVTYSTIQESLVEGALASMKKATTDDYGVVKIGDGLAVADGVVSIDPTRNFPIATDTTLGGIRTGFDKTANNFPISVDEVGVAHVNVPDVAVECPGLMTSELLEKVNGIAEGANNYVLPNATTESLGGIKVGDNLAIDSNGVLSARPQYELPTASAGQLGGIRIGSGLAIDTDGKVNLTATFDVPLATSTTVGGIRTGYVYESKPSDFAERNRYPVNIATSSTTQANVGKAYAEIKDATTTTPGLMTAADKRKLDNMPDSQLLALKDDIPQIEEPVASILAYDELISKGDTVFLGDALQNLASYMRIAYSNGIVEYNIRTKANVQDFIIPFYDYINNETATFSTSYVMQDRSTSQQGNMPRIGAVTTNDFFLGCDKSDKWSASITVKAIIGDQSTGNQLLVKTLTDSNVATCLQVT